ncbi:MAG: amino acid permease [Acidimicrobiales bacterium]|nr:MAG: amino acid permease [Acidimicrobiales bacterium]
MFPEPRVASYDSVLQTLKRLLIGTPIATSEEHTTRLGIPTALAVFASDAISSTAYATEEILLVLTPAIGMRALEDLVPIALVVAVLLVLVVSSYRQTVFAYPDGGGSYVVSRENLGELPSLVAGASLLVDYVLTVAVSVSAGIAAITSAVPDLRDSRVWLCLVAIGVMALANLRGTKESGALFAPPVYAYLVSLAALILIGLYRFWSGGLAPMEPHPERLSELGFDPAHTIEGAALALLVLRAFSSGAVALTGIEAISNGVPAFRKPESKHAATTLVIMGSILGSCFLGISLLAKALRPTVTHEETLLSIMARHVHGSDNPLYWILQVSTFAILILAANTAFADFPRVASILARDGYLPRQLANRGDRLVYSNGIFALAAIAGLLIVAFGGITSALIPLYAVGVFTGFTLSQMGMVRHHTKVREPSWKRKRIVNAVGACATGLVLLVVVVSKFTIGAWIPAVLIPLIVTVFRGVKRHYDRVSELLRVDRPWRSVRKEQTVVVLVGGVNRGVIEALNFARSLHPMRVLALSVAFTPQEEDKLREEWSRLAIPIELKVVYSPYRDLTQPVLQALDELDRDHPEDVITVVIPELLVSRWWQNLLHNQSALMLMAKLRTRPNTVVVNVPVHMRELEATS